MHLIEQAQRARRELQALRRELASTPSLPGPAGARGAAAGRGSDQRLFDELREIHTALERQSGGMSQLVGPGGPGA